MRNAGLALTNRLRLLSRREFGYVILQVRGHYPERTVVPRRRFPLSLLPWLELPLSIEAFSETLELIAGDPRFQGAVFLISGLSAEPAALNSLRQAIIRFRASGKQAVAYLHDLHMWPYYLASACHLILAPKSATFQSAGLRAEAIFLKDTLALLGIEADFEAIAEYKVSPDTFRRSHMTEPHREMLESLLDSIYTHLLTAIAVGRNMTVERIRDLFDSVPLSADQARELGLLDAICYEDELPDYLGQEGKPARLIPWDQAQRFVIRPRRWTSRFRIGIISIEGMIVPGTSRRLPFPLPLPAATTQAGANTLVRQLRAAAQDRTLAAVVLHVDSPGGSAFASDLIWREVVLLRRHKPVVAYMGNRAASGGYYVSVPANALFAQPTTLTGSIGIWGGKIVTRGLFAKIRANREEVLRGKSASLYADTAPFSDEERARIRAEIGAGYTRFKARVGEGRCMTDEQVEAVARGRVWTGEQALTHGLIDELGDLRAAADKARELAGLDPRRHVRLVSVPVPKRYPRPTTPATDIAEWLNALSQLSQERLFALAPWMIRLKD
ncbi:MAG: S49 family peptidase [Anaerolineae bacterium]